MLINYLMLEFQYIISITNIIDIFKVKEMKGLVCGANWESNVEDAMRRAELTCM